MFQIQQYLKMADIKGKLLGTEKWKKSREKPSQFGTITVSEKGVNTQVIPVNWGAAKNGQASCRRLWGLYFVHSMCCSEK